MQKKRRLYKDLIQRDKTVYKLTKKKDSIKQKKFDYVDEENEIIRREQFFKQRPFLSESLADCPEGRIFLIIESAPKVHSQPLPSFEFKSIELSQLPHELEEKVKNDQSLKIIDCAIWPKRKTIMLENKSFDVQEQSGYYFQNPQIQLSKNTMHNLPMFSYKRHNETIQPVEIKEEIVEEIMPEFDNFNICKNYSKIYEIPVQEIEEETPNKAELEFQNNYMFDYVDRTPKDMAIQTETPILNPPSEKSVESELAKSKDSHLYKSNCLTLLIRKELFTPNHQTLMTIFMSTKTSKKTQLSGFAIAKNST